MCELQCRGVGVVVVLSNVPEPGPLNAIIDHHVTPT